MKQLCVHMLFDTLWLRGDEFSYSNTYHGFLRVTACQRSKQEQALCQRKCDGLFL